LLGEMKTDLLVPDAITYTAAISACEKDALWELAVTLLREMNTRDGHAISATISVCAKAAQWEQALHILGNEPNLFAYTATISACEKAANWERALSLLDSMQASKVAPNVVAYNATMSACKEEWQHALAVFRRMRLAGVEPNQITYNAVIEACDQAAPAIASKLYLDAVECGVYSHWKRPYVLDFHDFPLCTAKAALRVVLEQNVDPLTKSI